MCFVSWQVYYGSFPQTWSSFCVQVKWGPAGSGRRRALCTLLRPPVQGFTEHYLQRDKIIWVCGYCETICIEEGRYSVGKWGTLRSHSNLEQSQIICSHAFYSTYSLSIVRECSPTTSNSSSSFSSPEEDARSVLAYWCVLNSSHGC